MLILSIIYQNVKEQEEKKGKRNKRIRNARGFLNKAHPSVAASKSWILFKVRTNKKIYTRSIKKYICMYAQSLHEKHQSDTNDIVLVFLLLTLRVCFRILLCILDNL